MIPSKAGQVFILGAGFSYYAGVPLQQEFTKVLLEALDYKESAPSRKLVEHLMKFVSRSFGGRAQIGHESWPDLEDIFTCIDLSANSGHHLGRHYGPAELRTLRRGLLSRTIRLLNQKITNARRQREANFLILNKFVRETNWERSAAISLNWDTLLEERILNLHRKFQIDYGCDAISADFPAQGRTVDLIKPARAKKVFLVKMHGSTNWLYCDNCRSLFHFPPDQTLRIADQLLGVKDRRYIGQQPTSRPLLACAYCNTVPLGTRIATFSYRKALEFPMFQKSWFSAAELLKRAEDWVFIGYSLPPADYEFKYLLKRVQLSRRKLPRLTLVTAGEKGQKTKDNYERFFGRIKVFDEGITDDFVSYVKSLSARKP